MFQSWRFKLREADTAYRQGRYDEAIRLLAEQDTSGPLPGRRLADRLVESLAKRARGRLLAGDMVEAWKDYDRIVNLAGGCDRATALRDELVDCVIVDCRGLLKASEYNRCLSKLDDLIRRGSGIEPVVALRETVRRVRSADQLAQRGKFAEAIEQLKVAAADGQCDLGARLQDYRQRQGQGRELSEQLHRAMIQHKWTEAVSAADRLLDIAPLSSLAREARKQAWARADTRISNTPISNTRISNTRISNTRISNTVVAESNGAESNGAESNGAESNGVESNGVESNGVAEADGTRATPGRPGDSASDISDETRAAPQSPQSDDNLSGIVAGGAEAGSHLNAISVDEQMGSTDESQRNREEGAQEPGQTTPEQTTPEQTTPELGQFFLWVDGVGGYLVCPADSVTIGQAVPMAGVDVPILGDISRRHAVIRRSGEGYVLEPIADTKLNGKIVDRPRVLLRDGDRLGMGAVELDFRQPHALSSTARLDFASHHGTQPSADGVILLADSCVMGPRKENHVVCRDWEHDVVLFRQKEQLHCRAVASFEVDGQLVDGHAVLSTNSQVGGDDFCISLEPLND